MEKDDNIVAIVAIAITLGFFAFLIYVLKALKEPTPIAPVSPQIIYVPQTPQVQIPQPSLQEVVATEEIRPTTASIINYHLNNANQWYEIKLPTDIITWQIKARGNYELLYSYSPAHQTYMTLVTGDILSADTAPNKNINAVYVMSATAGVVTELEVWRK